jgi:hypothetical protein
MTRLGLLTFVKLLLQYTLSLDIDSIGHRGIN